MKPRRPGAGLNFLFPSDEATTGKLQALPPEPDPLCPLCGGSGSLRTNPYDKVTCTLCMGREFVTRAVFDKFLVEHPHSLAAKQLKKGLPNT